MTKKMAYETDGQSSFHMPSFWGYRMDLLTEVAVFAVFAVQGPAGVLSFIGS